MKKLLIISLSMLFLSCGANDDLATYQASEQYPGGEASTNDFSKNAFSHAAPNLEGDKEMDFVTGNAFFKRNWVTAPASTEDLDGLGPLFNARSCSSCHLFDGRGAPPDKMNKESADLLIRLSVPVESDIEWETMPEPNYGDQFNHMANMGIPNEGDVVISYSEETGKYPDGESYSLRHPTYSFKNLNYGPMDKQVMISPRIAPQIIGLGLLEAISETQLKSIADPEDKNEDQISGRINYVYDIEQGKKMVGRFGWKANQPSVRQQVAAAFHGDIGITSSLFPEEICTPGQKDCNQALNGGNPELKEKILNRVTLYSQVLAVPERREWKSERILKGKKLFNEIGCNQCHIPSFKTDQHASLKEFEGQTIYPYTDLLLHDMGKGLADNRPDGLANGQEWRTPPLWGIGLIQTVNEHTFLLHDGRARNVEEAILWHGGEAQNSQASFKSLTKENREHLIAFVKSL